MLRTCHWLLRHPGALLDVARGAAPRDLILREDLRHMGYPLALDRAQGLGETRLNVALVERLARAFGATPPRTLLDVGAARGAFATAAEIAFEGLAVHSFEPNPEEFEALARRVTHAYPFALGDTSGSATLHVSANAGSSSLRRMLSSHVAAFPGTAVVRERTIEVRRLDDVVASARIELRAPVLLKIDVQGAESLVLRGAERTLAAVDTLIVELSLVPLYDDQPLADAVSAEIESLGFRRAGTFDEIRSAQGDLVQIDALFVRE